MSEADATELRALARCQALACNLRWQYGRLRPCAEHLADARRLDGAVPHQPPTAPSGVWVTDAFQGALFPDPTAEEAAEAEAERATERRREWRAALGHDEGS